MSPTRSTIASSLTELLTCKVRCVTVAQVARKYFEHTKRPLVSARNLISYVKANDLITLTRAMVPETFDLVRPLVDWYPGDGEPSFHQIAWRAEKRLLVPLVATVVVRATRKSQLHTAGPIGGRPLRSQEITHDLMVAALYFKLKEDCSDIADSWRPEDAILQELVRERGDFNQETIPDAIVCDGGEEIALEVVGRYSAKKLARIHQSYYMKRYQLW